MHCRYMRTGVQCHLPSRSHASMGRIKRKQVPQPPAEPAACSADAPLCPLCQRPIPPEQRDAHHFVPKSRGGRSTQLLHRLCHRQIHAIFSETELARQYNTAEALLAHPAMRSFVDWVKDKPPGFTQRVARHTRRRTA